MAEGETLTKFLMIWLICTVIFLIIDLVWLGMVAKPFYQRSIGHLMADDFRIGAAFLFYVFYVVGIVYFCVSGAVDWKAAAINGALFGFFCYATYDMTNFATLSGAQFLRPPQLGSALRWQKNLSAEITAAGKGHSSSASLAPRAAATSGIAMIVLRRST